jgi:hypothetical protein
VARAVPETVDFHRFQKTVEITGRRRGRRPDLTVRLRGNEGEETPTSRLRGRSSEEVLRAIAPLGLIGVIFVFVGELFARENFIFFRQELIQRRTLRETDCPLASVGERE